MRLDIQDKGFHDMRIIKMNGKVWEIVKMNWSTTKTGFYGA